jgi:hypothetical protein
VGRHALSPRRPYSRVFLAPSRRHLRIRFGNKVHPAVRSSILGHRVSGSAIRSGGMPALVHAVIASSRRQERDFHSARPRLLWKTLFSTSLLRSHYKGTAGERPERRSGGRDGRARWLVRLPEASWQKSDKRKKKSATPPGSLRPVCARPRRSSPFSRLFALLRSMSIFVPGFAITPTAFSATLTHRADPFSDEDLFSRFSR